MSPTKQDKLRRRAGCLLLERINEALDNGVSAEELYRLAEAYDLLRTTAERCGEYE